jgi:hypothetical protein
MESIITAYVITFGVAGVLMVLLIGTIAWGFARDWIDNRDISS